VLQIHADVSNVPITLTRNPDAPLLGCAILASVGAGFYQDVPSAVETMVQIESIVEPNAERHKTYKPFFESYKKTYSTLKNIRKNLED
jgi:Sugar (pentulose and hexulose) kinases